MSKAVRIPEGMYPFWECEINGVGYSYPAGTTQTVPNEVAALIEANKAMAPVENPPETSEQMAKRIADEEIDANLEFIRIPDTSPLSDTPAEITSVLSVDKLEILAGGAEGQLAVSFKYGDDMYQTSTYQADGTDLYFYANVSAEGAVTGIIEVKIYQSTSKVYAVANLTELGAGE